MSRLRIDFETWAAFEWQVTEFDRDEDGIYLDDNVQSMWIGYKGGRTSNAEVKPVMEYRNSPSGYHIVWETLDYGTHYLYEHPPQEKDDE